MGHRMKDVKFRWPNGVVYYDFKLPNVASLSQGDLQKWQRYDIPKLIEDCMTSWERYVNQYSSPQSIRLVRHIRFMKRPDDDTPYKLIDLTISGSSGVGENGYVTDKPFALNWRGDSTVIKSIPHELGHLLGLTHEHDRNVEGTTSNDGEPPRLCPKGDDILSLQSKSTRDKSEPFGDYDIWSIMHYPVMELKKGVGWFWNRDDNYLRSWTAAHPDSVYTGPLTNYPTPNDVVTQSWAPSAGDIANLRNMYPIK